MLSKNKSLTIARQAHLHARKAPTAATMSPGPGPNSPKNQDADDENPGDEIQCTGWSRGVAHCISSDEEPILISDNNDDGDEEEVEELSGSELEELIQQRMEGLAGTMTATVAIAAIVAMTA